MKKVKTASAQRKKTKKQIDRRCQPRNTRSWRGTWNRPLKVDEQSLHPFTIARMTNRNVRGVDDLPDERIPLRSTRKISRKSTRRHSKTAVAANRAKTRKTLARG